MIRLFEEEDLDEVLAIWLDANLRAHSFIPAGYWEGRREEVRQALPQAELYVWEERGEILGFLGLEGDYIAGMFVRLGAQSRGGGNTRAAAFYRREGFSALGEQTDAGTGEMERCMCWRSGGKEEPSC